MRIQSSQACVNGSSQLVQTQVFKLKLHFIASCELLVHILYTQEIIPSENLNARHVLWEFISHWTHNFVKWDVGRFPQWDISDWRSFPTSFLSRRNTGQPLQQFLPGDALFLLCSCVESNLVLRYRRFTGEKYRKIVITIGEAFALPFPQTVMLKIWICICLFCCICEEIEFLWIRRMYHTQRNNLWWVSDVPWKASKRQITH